jgi:hypothetical protein
MFKRYANEIHEKQAKEFISSLGTFVITFERVCDAMRQCILLIFRKEGLRNQSIAQAVIADRTAAPLREMLGSVYSCLKDQDAKDRKAVLKLLQRIDALGKFRNQLLHSCWEFGTAASEGEFFAATIKYKASRKKGAYSEIWGYSASFIEKMTKEATATQILLQRLAVCLNQNGFKVEKEFTRPM